MLFGQALRERDPTEISLLLRTIWGRAAAVSAATPNQLWKSSIREEIGGLELAPARSMGAKAPSRSPTGARQTIGKRLVVASSSPALYPRSSQSGTPS